MKIDQSKCMSCGMCSDECKNGAVKIDYMGKYTAPHIDENICIGCGMCAEICPAEAIS
jgi:electron transport complex protein RnfB